jgi:tRNA (guanine-N7-)-methyltransferase
MHGNSSFVHSSQRGLHPRLDDCVTRHLRSHFSPPIRPSTLEAADWIANAARSQPLVLDLGCGTGESTLALRALHPGALLVGVDRSLHRLRQHAIGELDTALQLQFFRADYFELVTALAEREVRAAKVWLLYPNPWPKSDHLKRRWHGHPAFRSLLQISTAIELRSNWPLYLDEFAHALRLAGCEAIDRRVLAVTTPLSPFEKKYAASAHPLFALNAHLA